MGTEVPRRALLLGLVEVRQPVEQLDVDGRARLFSLCHAASVARDVDESGWLGWQEQGLMGVEVTLDQEHLHVTNNEVLISRHSLADVGAIVALPGTEGHLVVVGQCQVMGLPLAVVLDMMSQADARRLGEDVRQRMSPLASFPGDTTAPRDTEYLEPLPHPTSDSSSGLPHTPGNRESQQTGELSAHASAATALGDVTATDMSDATMVVHTPLALLPRGSTSLMSTRPVVTQPVSVSLTSTRTIPTGGGPSPTAIPILSSRSVPGRRSKSKFWPCICCAS